MSGFFSSIKRATSASFDGQGASGEYRSCSAFPRDFLGHAFVGICRDFEVISGK